jgi:hypothetical protein
MNLFTVSIVSESGYAPREMRVGATSATEALSKGLARYLQTCGGCARVVLLRDEGPLVL